MKITTGIDLDLAMAVSKKADSMLGHGTDSYLLRAGKAGDLIRELPKGQIENQVIIKNIPPEDSHAGAQPV